MISGDKEETGKKEGKGIHEYRAKAQQKSMDTIRAAEERYNKAKESLRHGGQGGEAAAAVFGQQGPGRVGVELTREELESGAHGFHGEKARHAQLLAAGGEEIRERKGHEESVGGGDGRNATDTVTEKGRQAKESVGTGTAE